MKMQKVRILPNGSIFYSGLGHTQMVNIKDAYSKMYEVTVHQHPVGFDENKIPVFTYDVFVMKTIKKDQTARTKNMAAFEKGFTRKDLIIISKLNKIKWNKYKKRELLNVLNNRGLL